MPIKSTESQTPCTKKEIPCPKLMWFPHRSMILLVSKIVGKTHHAVVVSQGSGICQVGTADSWTTPDLVDYTGSVCLENERD